LLRDASMLATYTDDDASAGSFETSWFHALSFGNTWQPPIVGAAPPETGGLGGGDGGAGGAVMQAAHADATSAHTTNRALGTVPPSPCWEIGAEVVET
jgi:hypothetical protein